MNEMNRVARPTPVALATAMLLGALYPPFAQAQAQSAAPRPAAAASTPEAEAPDVTEVVITAQKRTERLKDTPVAASVLGENLLQNANATSISDINQLVPSVELKGSFNGRVPMAMRGISTNANEAAVGLTSGVSIMIDGVPLPSDSTAANELQDIKRVEVLKGPQSTLGGRTASAGVINFVTKTPTRRWTGSAGVTLTNDGERRGEGFLSGPLSDIASFSISLYDGRREYPIRNLLTGKYSESTSEGARFKLLLRPDDDTDITLTARVADNKSSGETFTYQYITPGATLFPFFAWNPAGISQAVALPGIDVRHGNIDYASPVPMASSSTDSDFSANVEHRVGGYSFTSTTASQSEVQHLLQDVPIVAVRWLDELRQPVIPLPPTPGVPPLFDGSQHFEIRPRSLSQEFKVASPTDGFLSYVAGVFLSKVDVSDVTLRDMFVNPLDNTVTSDTQTAGLYGRGTWSLAADTSLLTGLRINRDRVSYSIVDRSGGFHSEGSDVATSTVGDLTLRQKLGKDQMVYATYARGYKPRAFNTAQTLASDAPLNPVDKEHINHFELGAKSTLFGGSLTLNAALFNTDYKNYQVQIFDNSTVVSQLSLSNAGEARTRGLELDGNLAATSSTRVTAALAYIDAKFVKYQGAPCYPGQTATLGCVSSGTATSQDLSGKTMPDSPKFKITTGIEHDIEEAVAGWDARLNAQYAYRTAANFQADNNPETRQAAFGILNLGASLTSPTGRHVVGAFVNNVTNKFYLVNAEDFFGGLWNANAVIGQPARDARRYFGVRYNLYFD